MNPQARLEHIYGIPFPESFFAFWDFVRTYPSLFAILEIDLVGPFNFLMETENHAHWKARYYDDPPEFLTVACGTMDGLHWGYYLDDPGHPSFPIASFYSTIGLNISVDGETLFEAVQEELEYCYRGNLEYLRGDPEYRKDYEQRLSQLTLLRTGPLRFLLLIFKSFASSLSDETTQRAHVLGHVSFVPFIP